MHPRVPSAVGQRMRVLFERKLRGGLAVSCEGGPLGSVMPPPTGAGGGGSLRSAVSSRCVSRAGGPGCAGVTRQI
jgi:hypothetical protein